ncbi:MAG: hypothetical protein FWG56_07060 [Desulfovibrionaceae bacterium]|nr:hypothetical protein [Desulfovibrionaceae bacterium]
MMYRVPDRIHHELLNWSRWCWLGDWPHPLPPVRCASAEGQYRAPPEFDDEVAGAPAPIRIQPNERNARLVQQAWAALHEKPRRVLKAEYPAYCGSRTQAARALLMTIREYETHLRYAVNQVEAKFAVCA